MNLLTSALSSYARQQLSEKSVESCGFVTKNNELEPEVNFFWAHGTLQKLWSTISYYNKRALVLVYKDMENPPHAPARPWELIQAEELLRENEENAVSL